MKQLNKNITDKINLGKIYGNIVFEDTVKYAKKYGFKIGTGKNATWNNEADAFKHTYMQAQLTLWSGKHVANGLGYFHEIQGDILNKQSKEEKQMDLWNNAQGRKIAKEIIDEYGIFATMPFNSFINDIIAEKVVKKMRNGELITTPFDVNKKYTKTKDFISDTFNFEIELNEVEKIKKDLLKHYEQKLKRELINKFYNTNGHWVTIDGNHVLIKD